MCTHSGGVSFLTFWKFITEFLDTSESGEKTFPALAKAENSCAISLTWTWLIFSLGSLAWPGFTWLCLAWMTVWPLVQKWLHFSELSPLPLKEKKKGGEEGEGVKTRTSFLRLYFRSFKQVSNLSCWLRLFRCTNLEKKRKKYNWLFHFSCFFGKVFVSSEILFDRFVLDVGDIIVAGSRCPEHLVPEHFVTHDLVRSI